MLQIWLRRFDPFVGPILYGGGSSVSERPSESSPENDIDEAEIEETVPKVEVEPIRTVVRELTRPDGTTITVEVPVYPPFEVKDIATGPSSKPTAYGKRARSK